MFKALYRENLRLSMDVRNSLGLLIGGIALLLLSGCAHYNARPLSYLSVKAPCYVDEQYITYNYRIFSKADCRKYLDRNVISKGFQPIQITIKNHSDRYLNFSLDSITLPCLSADEVAQSVRCSTSKRVTSYGIGSLFLPVLIVPAVIDGFKSTEANELLFADFFRKVLKDQLIAPHATINGLIFVPSADAKEPLALTITDQETGEKFVLSQSDLKVAVK